MRALAALLGGFLLAPALAQDNLGIDQLTAIAQSHLDQGEIGYRCRPTPVSQFSDFHTKLAKAAAEATERGDTVFVCAPYAKSGKFGIRDGGIVIFVNSRGATGHREFVL
jgi:hypothetical protein